jgi:hypothetical protein
MLLLFCQVSGYEITMKIILCDLYERVGEADCFALYLVRLQSGSTLEVHGWGSGGSGCHRIAVPSL